MAFLDHIDACNNFVASGFRPFFVGQDRVGYIRHDLVDAFRRWPDVFHVSEDAIRLDDALDDFDKRSEAIEAPLRQLADEGGITGWRGEIYPVKPDWHATPLMQVERAATFACPNRASFGNAAEGRVRFCSLHKRLDDVNLNIKRKCSAQGCCRYPSFCGPASRHPTFCAQHRPDGFVHATNLPKSRPNLLPTDRSRLW